MKMPHTVALSRLATLLPACALLAAAAPGQPPPLHVLAGAAAGDRLGSAVAAAGDVDGDGYDDWIAGAPGDDTGGSEAGSARVVSGRTGALLHAFVGGPGDRLGSAVAGAGDVDGDGHADVIAGAPGDSFHGPDAGSARVFSGRTGAQLYRFRGDAAGDMLGASVAGAGDVDADGYADLIAGAPGDDDGGADAGSARVWSGRDGAMLRTVHGGGSGDALGYAVGGAGDFNGDGFADLVVGAPYDDDAGTDAGRVFVYSGASGAVLTVLDGVAAGDLFGWSVGGAGNVDGDTFADVVAGAPGSSLGGPATGYVRVSHGPAGFASRYAYGETAGDGFGTSVAGAGDVDGDGLSDVLAGAPGSDRGAVDGGAVRVWSVLSAARLYTLEGTVPGGELGRAVGGAGDADGDGFADFTAGAPFDDTGATSAGSARVWAIAPYARHVASLTLHPAVSRGQFGSSCAYVGDVDGDGRRDYAVGAPWDVGTLGAVRVYSGADHALLRTFFGASPNVYFGIKLASAGDIDQDGYGDVIVGSVHDNTVAQQCGAVWVYSGRTGGVLHTFFGPQARTHMGTCVGTIGDVDGDTVDDLFLGLGTLNTENGEIWVMSGRTGARIYNVPGPNDSWFGWCGSPVGDLDGDGYTDFLVGGPEPVSGGPGFARVLSGVDGSTIYHFDGSAPGDLFGFHCAAAGDVDGDGKIDLLVSGYTADPFQRVDAGIARVFSGADGSLLYQLAGEAAGDMFGDGVGGAGDVNGDGYDDFLVGASGADPNGMVDAGAAYLYSGRDGTLLHRYDGAAAGDFFGKTLTGIGDVNGDGFAELIVGAPLADVPSMDAGAALVLASEPDADPGSFRSYGAGCPGSNGRLPTIGVLGRPRIGAPFRPTLYAARPTTPTALSIDAMRQNLPLGSLGAPACTLLALPLLSVPVVTGTNGSASVNVPVPAIPALIGGAVYLQWAIADSGATALGLAFSNGGKASLGRP